MLTDRSLKAVVVVNAIETRPLQACGLIAKIWHAQENVLHGVRGDAIHRVGGTGEFRRILVVVVIGLVDAAGADEAQFEHQCGRNSY